MTSTSNSSSNIFRPHGPHLYQHEHPAHNIPESSTSSFHSGAHSEGNGNIVPNNPNLAQHNNENNNAEQIIDGGINNSNVENNNINLRLNNNFINIPNEQVEGKKSQNSINHLVPFNSDNLKNVIAHIDDLATKYDNTVKSLNDTLKSNTETLKILNETLNNIDKNNTDIMNKFIDVLEKLINK